MDTRSFRWRILFLYGALALFVLGFPWLLKGLMQITDCQRVGGACGAVAALAGMYLRPLGVMAFLVGMGIAVYKRGRGVGVTGWWVVATILWIMGSSSFLTAVNNFWGANFGMGILFVNSPVLLVFLLTYTMFLAVNQQGLSLMEGTSHISMAWTVAGCSAGLGFFLQMKEIIVPALPLLFFFGEGVTNVVLSFSRAFYTLIPLQISHILTWIAALIFSMALLYIFFQSRQSPMASQTGLGTVEEV